MWSRRLKKKIYKLVEEFVELGIHQDERYRYKLAKKIAKNAPPKFHEFVKMLQEADVIRRGKKLKELP